MKRVYTAPNLPDAHLLCALLQRAGIPAHVFNENAASLVGFVPVGSSQPQVWIAQPHQESHAKEIIGDYQNRPADNSLWQCSACGEMNPGEFEICWQCGKS